MKAVKDIERKIRAKEEEINQLKIEIARAQAYVDGMRESLKMFARIESVVETSTIRPNSMVGRAVIAIQNAGRPLYITDLLKAMGESTEKKKRISLSSSIAFYVRRNEVFTRPAPNTFGLVELNEANGSKDEEDLPF